MNDELKHLKIVVDKLNFNDDNIKDDLNYLLIILSDYLKK